MPDASGLLRRRPPSAPSQFLGLWAACPKADGAGFRPSEMDFSGPEGVRVSRRVHA